jgi:5-methylcytosine-specific restriction endonuclease McrA
MLRQDSRAGFQSKPFFLFWTRYQFSAGRDAIGAVLSKSSYRRIYAEQERAPVLVCTQGRRRWWAFKGRIYWEDEDYHRDDVAALVLARERRKERQLERARDLMSLEAEPSTVREPIPENVRRYVFRRDGGQCVKCRSRELLQFDHIIPVALGGSSSVGNLQVLCMTCNREKSDSI